MPIYKYTAKNLQAERVHGKKEAEDEAALSAALRSEGFFLLSSIAIAEETKSVYRPKPNELADFASELGTMLTSGITLVRAMYIILQGDIKPKLSVLYRKVYNSIQRGNSFSEALEEQEGAFPQLMINMIRSGEASGKMDQATQKIASHYQNDYKMRSKIKSAMTYPVILICVGFLIFLGLFVFVLPSFFETFEDLEIELPAITRAMVFLSNLLTQHWLACIFVVMGIILVISFLLKSERMRYKLDRLKLRLPKIGNLLRTIYTARFARTLSTLYTSGLSIMQALTVAADTIGNRYISGQFDKVTAQVRSGSPLSAALQEVDGFAPKLISVTRIGEESGRLDEMLDHMAASFDFESEKAIDRLISMLEPIMIVILGIGVGFVMVSVMLPLYTMYQNM